MTNRRGELWPEAPEEVDDVVTLRAVLETPSAGRREIWYRLPAIQREAVAEGADPFVLATLFSVMRERIPLRVHGRVSPSLLANLEEFQAAWGCWRPGRYAAVEITADHEVEPAAGRSDRVLTAFSGGLDSAFTLWRHARGRAGRRNLNIDAGLMVHGFDIPLDDGQAADRAFLNSQAMLADVGARALRVATNFRQLGDRWGDAHGAGLASALSLFAGGFGTGAIPSSEPYSNFVVWGSNPTTDWMMSSDAFRIVHDGASLNRQAKASRLGDWEAGLARLRVCWQGPDKHRNCGKCEKCIRTILNFRVAGLGLPACFERDATDADIDGIQGLNDIQLAELRYILAEAKARSLDADWVEVLRATVWRNAEALRAKRRKPKKRAAPK